MKFQTQNYESKNVGGNIPAGNYEFIVASAEERESRAGNPMINLELLIVVPDRDNPVKVYDCLVFTDAAIFKIEQFCNATGMPEKFQNNDGNVNVELSEFDCVNKQGMARFEPDPQSGYLRPKYYLNPAGKPQQQQANGYQASPKAKSPTAPPRNTPPAPPAPFKAAAPPTPSAETPDDSFDPDDIPF